MLFPDFDLFMLEAGEMRVQWPDGQWITARPGTFVLIPPLTLVRVHRPGPELVYWFCHFNFRVLPSTLHWRLQPDYFGPRSPSTVPLFFRKSEAPGVARAYRALTRVKPSENERPWRYEAALLTLVGELRLFGSRRRMRSAAPAPPAQDARLSRILARINAEPQRRWSVPELAQSVGLSADRLNTISQRFTRRTVKQHVLHARFQLAFQLLRAAGDERPSIKEVSARCGFASQHFFCKLFKRWFKLTPSEFRDGTLVT